MKTCSAWNWETLEYTYYQCPGEQSIGGWTPPRFDKPQPGQGLGIHIEDALPSLPYGCKIIGKGSDARGQIVKPVSNGVGLGLFPADFLAKRLVVDVALGVVVALAVGWAVSKLAGR